MPLNSGSRLGAYEIQSPLGAGGMGEVYRARDTRLDREVAIKVLPEHLSHQPEARERFEREARAISSLSHPNICHLYDVGEQDGINYLVMEYLEGETLADQLCKGPLALERAWKVGIEICEGLEKAHRSGLVHRDLKPSNIMLTKSGAKLMDFGLAKTTVVMKDSSASLATRSQPLTAEGSIVGTFQYMSPEQVEGQEADVRSDIFALGAVLYEMITGKRAFEGKTTASTIANILAGEPKPISTLQPMSPPTFELLVKACLAKDPEERIQTAHDAKLQLKWISESSNLGTATPVTRQRGWNRAGQLLAILLPLLAIAGGVPWWLDAHRTPTPMYFFNAFSFPTSDVALSRDGRMVAMVAYSDQTNKYMIWTQDVGGQRATVVPGTEDAFHPFWSPDSRSIGFFSQGKLKKVDAFSGRSAQAICDAPHGRGGAWNRDGVILFSPDGSAGLYQVSSAGGTPTAVTQVDTARSEFSHRWPVFLPDGRHYLYLAANFSGKLEKNEIFLGSLDSTEKRPIVSASSNAAYADPGYLLYMRDHSLVAQKFDSRSYVLSGEPHAVSDEVQYFPLLDLAVFDVVGKHTLVVQTGKGADKSQLLWFDRSGRSVGAVGKPSVFANPRISPDGHQVVVDQTDSDGRRVNIWIHGVGNETTEPLTFSPAAEQIPVWSPDGKQIVFGSNQKFHFSLYQKDSDGAGAEHEISDLGAQQQGPWDWSHDGKYMLVMKGPEVWYLSMPDWHAQPYLQAKWPVRNAQFSPDGNWVAYSTNETGNWEIYVSPFPTATSKWQVSRGGGEEPRWRRNGKELFYLSGDGKMMAVAVKTGSSFEAGPPVALFQTHLRQQLSFMDVFSYDVASDGEKFLVNSKIDEPNAPPLSVVLNWASEMEK